MIECFAHVTDRGGLETLAGSDIVINIFTQGFGFCCGATSFSRWTNAHGNLPIELGCLAPSLFNRHFWKSAKRCPLWFPVDSPEQAEGFDSGRGDPKVKSGGLGVFVGAATRHRCGKRGETGFCEVDGGFAHTDRGYIVGLRRGYGLRVF